MAARTPCALALLLAACGSPAEREARELGSLRERAAEGIEAVERFCTARDTAIAHVQQGGPGSEVLLEEVLLTPVVLDDYCEEFRFHEHDDESHDDEPAGVPATGSDTAAADRARVPGG